jgi:hypothetical protein
MSIGNFQVNRNRAYQLNKKTISATYTVRVGASSDQFVMDNPIVVDDPSDDFTITVPDAVEIGQTWMVVLESNTNSKTVTITTTTGDDNTLDTEGDFALYVWAGDTSGWQQITGEVAS